MTYDDHIEIGIGGSPGRDTLALLFGCDAISPPRSPQISLRRKLAPGTLDIWLADIQNDRVFYLPLGNSDEVLPQAKIQALGMPGNAFNPALMDNEVRFKVSARNGQIGQTKRMKGSGGWDAFEMSAPLDHGDSDGTVLGVQGKVIAINMAVANDLSNPLRLVVPINLAKEMLTKAGVVPDPGKLSAHWEMIPIEKREPISILRVGPVVTGN